MSFVQFDLRPPQPAATRIPIRQRYNPARRWGVPVIGTPRWAKRIWLYGLAVVAAGLLLIWQHGQSSAIAEASEQGDEVFATEQRLITAAVMGKAEARTLAARGFAALEVDDLATASLYLRSAATKDPKYRDAALYAGYAELARADGQWNTAPAEAEKRTKTAVTLLEQAKLIDPIHAYTYELLAIAYTNLGKTDLATDARAKQQAFAQTNITAQ